MEKQLFQKAYAALQTISMEETLKEALRKILSDVLSDPKKTETAIRMYRYYYEREIPFGRELSEDGEDVVQGRISTAVFFARAVWLDQEKCYELPAGSGEFVDQVLRFLRDNQAKYGHYAMIGGSRFLGYAHTFPYIFRLGRLEFEIASFAYPFTVYEENGCIWEIVEQNHEGASGKITGRQYRKDGLEMGESVTLQNPRALLKQGDPVLSVHIPGGTPMTAQSVEASFAIAPAFFQRYFPQTEFKGYICSSWLLNSDLKRFLKADSNILQFQKRFRIPFRQRYDGALYAYIFQLPRACPLEELVPQNRFQKEVLDYVKAGGVLYSGRGYILLS